MLDDNIQSKIKHTSQQDGRGGPRTGKRPRFLS